MSYKHEMHAWEQLQASLAEVERVAGLIAETQPTWSGHLKRLVQGIRDGYAGDAPRPEGGARQTEEARRFRDIQAIYAEEYRLRDSIKAEMKEAGARGELMMNGQCKDWPAYENMIATREELVEALVVSPL